MKININIIRSHLGITAIITDPQGYTFAVRFAPDTVVTEKLIRASWHTNRRAWRAFNTTFNTFT